MTTESTVPILVCSCDRYADLWAPFFGVFRYRWPDCPYPLYLITNTRTYPDPRVTCLAVGPDLGWGSNLLVSLNRIEAEQVILFLDDFFLTGPVDTDRVRQTVATAKAYDIDCLRFRSDGTFLGPLPEPPGVGEILPGEPYRVSSQVAVWKKDFLCCLLRPHFSIWQFEVLGTLLCDRMKAKVWGSRQGVIEYRHGLERGRWLRRGLEDCAAAGVTVDPPARGIMSDEEFRQRGQQERRKLKGRILRALPPRWQRFVRLHRPRPGLQKILEPPACGLSEVFR